MSESRERRWRQPRRGWSVPLLYGGVTTALLFGVLALALSSPPPRTPPLAAVAPQVSDQIDVERVEQSSQFGEGAGGEGDCAPGDDGCAGTAPSPTTSAASPPTVQQPASVGQFWPCVVGPTGSRQSEDPQSPPCIGERFSGDNGGATTPGVTPTEIRIAVPIVEGDGADQYRRALRGWVAHFERHYELYGRRLALVEVRSPQSTAQHADPATQRAFAAEVAAAEPFATLGYLSFGAFQRELAARGVISLVKGAEEGVVSEAELASLHPYVWGVAPPLEETLQMAGDLACTALAGRPARHADGDLSGRTRTFALIQQTPYFNGAHYRADVLASRLTACGAPHRVYDDRSGETDLELLVRRIRDDGATTVVCVCESLRGDYQEHAEALGFRPEWLLPGIDEQSIWLRQVHHNADNFPRAQLANTFGLGAKLRRPEHDVMRGVVRFEEHYWYHAAREGDAAFKTDTVHVLTEAYYHLYAQLLILVSGIQWAGPDLTPETFAAALRQLRYPNPGVGQAPWWQPAVGFGPADHSFNSDFAMFWWQDASDTGYQSNTDFGQMCFVGDGARFTTATLPRNADDLLFNGAAGCR